MLNPMSLASWAEQEVGGAACGDRRLTHRYVGVLTALAAQPHAPVSQACAGDWASTKALYRFWDHAAVSPAALRAPPLAASAARAAAEDTILALQDTTDLDFTAHPATRGLGYLAQPQLHGLKVHSVLGVSLRGVPLGLLAQTSWTRDPATLGLAAPARQRATADKESGRWLTALQATHATVASHVRIITVADREADVFDFFAAARPANSEVLIRATHNRALTGAIPYAWEALQTAPVAGEQEVAVPARDGQPARHAQVAVRYTTVEIKPPRHHLRRGQLRPVPVQLILAEEVAPPPEVKPVRWVLLTTLAVTSFAQAGQCVEWYRYRWLIERYHFVLKSGCRLEQLQLRTAERLERAGATYCVVAWRLLWLTYESREGGAAPCTVALRPSEWQALACRMTGQAEPPAQPPSLRQAVRWIAQLGGFLGRAGDGEPGVQVLWRGWSRLQDLAALWELLHPS